MYLEIYNIYNQRREVMFDGLKKIKLSEMSTGQKAVYFLGMLAVLAVLGPLAAMAATTVTNIFTAVIFGLGIFVIVMLFPVLSRFLRNLSLKLMKAGARMNPIETLQNDYIQKKKALENFVKFVTSMIAAHKVSQDELNELKKRFPERTKKTNRQKMVDQMGAAVKLLRKKAQEAERKLDLYKEEVEFIAADHQFATRVGGAMTQLKNVEGVDALDELLKNEAIGAVRQDVATAFAELDMLLAQDDTKAAMRIAHDANPDLIELTAVEVPELVGAKS